MQGPYNSRQWQHSFGFNKAVNSITIVDSQGIKIRILELVYVFWNFEVIVM